MLRVKRQLMFLGIKGKNFSILRTLSTEAEHVLVIRPAVQGGSEEVWQ